MKKILGLGIAALLVIAMVAAGTYAYFQDSETSSGNTITAGTLDLNWNGGNADHTLFAVLADAKPGDSDKAPGPSAALLAAGSLTGKLSIVFETVVDTESTGSSEFEADGGTGELGAQVKIAPWLDFDGDHNFDIGTDIVLTPTGPSTAGLVWNTVDSFSAKTFTDVIAAFAPTDTADFYLPWDFVDTGVAVNTAQGDSFSIGITFNFKQA